MPPGRREQIAKTCAPQTRWLGFKLLFRSSDKWLVHPRFSLPLWLDRMENYLQWLSKRRDTHIIHIVRCDAIEWLKSKYPAYSRQYREGVKVEIPLRETIKRLRAKNWVDGRLATLADTNPYIRISYEDFADSSHETTAHVLRFRQCDAMERCRIEHRVRRQSKGSAADYILNYNQLITELGRRDLLKAQICR